MHVKTKSDVSWLSQKGVASIIHGGLDAHVGIFSPAITPRVFGDEILQSSRSDSLSDGSVGLNALVNLNRLRVDQGGPEYTEASIEEADTEALIEELEKLD